MPVSILKHCMAYLFKNKGPHHVNRINNIIFYFSFTYCIIFKGVISAKMVKIIKFLFFAQKVSSGMGALRPKFLGSFFFSFSIENEKNERKWKKYVVHFAGNLSRISKLFFFSF